MKNLKKIAILSSLALMAAVSCNKEEMSNDSVADHVLIASLEKSADTKVAMNPETQKLVWNKNCEILAYDAAGNRNVYKCANATTGEFTLASGTVEPGNLAHAFTGYSNHGYEFNKNSSGKFKAKINPQYTAKDNSYLFNMPLYGKLNYADEQLSAKFMYTTGVLCLKFTNLPKETVSLILKSDQRINSTYEFNIADEVKEGMEIKLKSASAEGQKEIEMVVADAASETPLSKTVYFPLVTGEHKILDVFAKLVDGTRVGLCSFTDKTVERAHIYTVVRDFSSLDPNAGQFSILPDADGKWTSTHATKMELEQGKYYAITTNHNGTRCRGDIKYDGSAVLHAGNFPIVAIKIEDTNDLDEAYTKRNINLDLVSKDETIKGNVGGNNNKWVNDYKCSDGSHVFLYNLATQQLDASGTKSSLPIDSAVEFTSFQIKYADIETCTAPITYKIYWVQTFRTVDEVKAYIESEGLTYEVIK